jgi:hypothetical protein
MDVDARQEASRPDELAVYIDPPTHHFLKDRLFDIKLVPYNGHELMAPYVYLREFFADRGIPVRTADFLPAEESEVLNVYVSIGNLQNYRKLARRRDVRLSAFIAMECPVVEPSMYRRLRHVQKHFGHILSWSDSASLERFVGGPIRCEPFFWPQSFDDVHEEIWKRTDRKFLVMMNGNKLPRVYWRELYTERLRALEFFSRTEEIDLYGRDWDKPPVRVGKTWVPRTLKRIQYELVTEWQRFHPDPVMIAARRVYRGPADSKPETLGQYKFALCFENSILKGWITEKIFDCLFAGTVPVYWGAPDIERYLPEGCFIDMRRFASYQDLSDFLKSLGEAEIRQYKDNARDYLRSKQYRPFTKQAFVDLFCRLVEEAGGIQLSPQTTRSHAC